MPSRLLLFPHFRLDDVDDGNTARITHAPADFLFIRDMPSPIDTRSQYGTILWVDALFSCDSSFLCRDFCQNLVVRLWLLWFLAPNTSTTNDELLVCIWLHLVFIEINIWVFNSITSEVLCNWQLSFVSNRMIAIRNADITHFIPHKCYHFLLSICGGAEWGEHCEAIVIVPSVAAATAIVATTGPAAAIHHYIIVQSTLIITIVIMNIIIVMMITFVGATQPNRHFFAKCTRHRPFYVRLIMNRR